MRGTICNALPWLALILTLLGMRDWDPIIPVGLLAVICPSRPARQPNV